MEVVLVNILGAARAWREVEPDSARDMEVEFVASFLAAKRVREREVLSYALNMAVDGDAKQMAATKAPKVLPAFVVLMVAVGAAKQKVAAPTALEVDTSIASGMVEGLAAQLMDAPSLCNTIRHFVRDMEQDGAVSFREDATQWRVTDFRFASVMVAGIVAKRMAAGSMYRV